MEQAIVYGVAVLPLIVGLVEFSKKMGLPVKFAPAIALVLGIAAAFVVGYSKGSMNPVECIVVGLGYGLAASGLYSNVKIGNK